MVRHAERGTVVIPVNPFPVARGRTETTSLFVLLPAEAFDDGERGRAFKNGLPDTPASDLVVENNSLAIGTHGRGFYVMDDLSALRQFGTPATSTVVLYKPADVIRGLERAGISYYLTTQPKNLTIEFLDAKGQIVIVEIKVSRADLLGDGKWPDYLDFCDRFYWGLPPELDRACLEGANFRPECCGVIVADSYDAEIVRPAPLHPLAPARRKAEIERLARAALRRQLVLTDPRCAAWGEG